MGTVPPDPEPFLNSHRDQHMDDFYRECITLLEDYNTPATIADDCVTFFAYLAEDPDNAAAKPDFNYWLAARRAAQAAKTREDIKNVARRYVCVDTPHSASRYGVVQALMKSAIYILWRKAYELRARAGHTDPREAILDAMTTPRLRAIYYFREICNEIAAEGGETAEQMVARVCGNDPSAEK